MLAVATGSDMINPKKLSDTQINHTYFKQFIRSALTRLRS